MSIKLFNNPLLERALSASWARNEAISENIANADTPGYKRKDVNFDEYLKAAMKKDALSGMVPRSNVSPINGDSNEDQEESAGDVNLRTIRDFNSTSMRLDGNNVDIDKEMSELAKNEILFNAYATLMNKDFGLMKMAIREGR